MVTVEPSRNELSWRELERRSLERRFLEAEEALERDLELLFSVFKVRPEGETRVTHDYHEGLEGYVAGAIFQDGCEECEYRAAHFELGYMDMSTWARARSRALELVEKGLKTSECENQVLRAIAQVLLKEREFSVASLVEAQAEKWSMPE